MKEAAKTAQLANESGGTPRKSGSRHGRNSNKPAKRSKHELNLTNALNQMEQQAQTEEAQPSEVIRQVKEKVAQEPNLAKALDQVKEAVKTQAANKSSGAIRKSGSRHGQIPTSGPTGPSASELTNALNQIEQQAQTEEVKPSEVIRQVKEKVAQEPNLTKALDQVKEAIKTAPLPTKIVEQLEKAVQDTAKLQQAGQTAQAPVNLTHALIANRTTSTNGNNQAKRSRQSAERKSNPRTESN